MKHLHAKSLLLLPFFVLLSACAPKSGGGNNDDANAYAAYAYEFQDGNCHGGSTGPQRPQSLQSMCENLRDDARNNNCAIESRYQRFNERCPGQSWNRGGDNNRGHRGPQNRPEGQPRR